jgi:DNA-binding transcriptional MerR regulator
MAVRIGQVAKQAGVTVDAVRFYERVGVLAPPARTESGYRDYRPETVDRIRLTRELQAIGFTLADAIDALAAHDAGGATCESERWRLQAVLDRVDAKLAELEALRGRIVEAQAACDAGRCLFKRETPMAVQPRNAHSSARP